MRRLVRASILSLSCLLLVLGIAAWIRSARTADTFEWQPQDGSRRWMFASIRGRMTFGTFSRPDGLPIPPLNSRHNSAPALENMGGPFLPKFNVGGFQWTEGGDAMRIWHSFALPYWFAVTVTTIPLASAIRRRFTAR